MPSGLAEEVHQALAQGKAAEAENICREHPSVLARMLSAGVDEIRIGYAAVEKAMEDAAIEQSARLLRRVEYLTTIGTVAPMLGLLGTVLGMISAFAKIAASQSTGTDPTKLANDISFALLTTAIGLVIAIPLVLAGNLIHVRIGKLQDAVQHDLGVFLEDLEDTQAAGGTSA